MMMLSILANIFIQSAIIVACGLALAWLARKRAAALECAVLRATLVAVLLSPALGLLPEGIKPPLFTVSIDRRAAPAPVVRLRERIETAPSPPWTAGVFGSASLAGLWILASLVLVARIGSAGVFIARLRRLAQPASDWISERCADLSERLGVEPPPVLESDRVRSPILAGVRSPAIVLPDGASESDDATDAVLLHELAHLKRCDVAWQALAKLACALLFFQPLVWCLARRIEDANDLACDDAVVGCGLRPKAYAHALLAWAARERPAWREALVGAGVIRFRSSLGQRVARILDASLPRALHARTPILAILLLAGAGIGAAGVLGVQDREPPAERRPAPREIRDGERDRDRPREVEPDRPREGEPERRRDVEPDRPRGERGEAEPDRPRERADRPDREGERDRPREGERDVREEERRIRPDAEREREVGETRDRD